MEALAERIVQYATEADEKTIEAALLVREARARVDGGEAGNTTWYAWAPKNIGLSISRLRDLQRIAEAENPRQELERQRKMTRKRVEKHRQKKEAKQTMPLRSGDRDTVKVTAEPEEDRQSPSETSSEHGGTHTKKQVRQIARSIERFGFNNPVLVDREDGIVAGHGRVEAAKALGLETIPTVSLEDLTEAEVRAYVIADNRLAELAGWDRELLAIELQGLLDLDLDLDVTLTGFETPEIDVLIGELESEDDEDSDDEIPPLDEGPPVTRPGDIWSIGQHRLICGDATDPDIYARLLDGAEAQMVFTDPPYNVAIDGHVSGLGKVKHREFAMASGEMSKEQFTAFLLAAFRNLAGHSADGAINFICIDWRHMGEILAAGYQAYTELKNLCVWSKTNGGMGSLYRSQHELVFVFKVGTGPHINNVELGRHGRYRTNVWSYPGINSFGRTRDADLASHPTVKPVALVKDAILDCSKRGGLVLDAFAGSGTTLVAAAKAGRRGYGIELDPRYCDLIVRRVAAAAGVAAIHAATGKPFAEVEQKRRNQIAAAPSKDTTSQEEVGHVGG